MSGSGEVDCAIVGGAAGDGSSGPTTMTKQEMDSGYPEAPFPGYMPYPAGPYDPYMSAPPFMPPFPDPAMMAMMPMMPPMQ